MTESTLRSRGDYQIFEGKKVIFEGLAEYVPPTPRITPELQNLDRLTCSARLVIRKTVWKQDWPAGMAEKLTNFLNAHICFAFQKFGFWCSQSQFHQEPAIVTRALSAKHSNHISIHHCFESAIWMFSGQSHV